jgi:hypothetical protein
MKTDSQEHTLAKVCEVLSSVIGVAITPNMTFKHIAQKATDNSKEIPDSIAFPRMRKRNRK